MLSFHEKLRQHFDGEGISQKDLSEKLGVSKAYVNSLFTGKSAFGKKQAELWEKNFGLSAAWLLTGEGEMLVSPSAAPVHSEEEVLTDRNSLKHFYEMDVTASNIENLTDNEQNAPFRRLLIPGYEGCVAFNVAGESMLPTARPGDLAAIDPRPVERIVNGEIYMLVTRDGQRMIKRLMRLPDDTGVRCFSDNDKKQWYAPFDIEAEMVVHAYRVRGFISITNLV